MNMMNAGLSALMPGQAAPNMAGVLPQPSQAAPNAVPSKVDALARLPFEQLQAMYRNPPKGVPAYAIIAARDKQIKAEQMREAQQGLMAQQQVAGQQGTVADNVMGMDTVYAASGGEMRVQKYAKGGLSAADVEALDEETVAEDNRPYLDRLIDLLGGKVPQATERPGARERAATRVPTVPVPELDILRLEEPLFDTLLGRLRRRSETPPVNTRAAYPEPRAVREARLPAGLAAASGAPPAASRTPSVTTRQPPPEQKPPPATTQQRQQSQAPAFDIDALTSAIEQTGVIPPEILEERKALAAARKAQLERQQAAAQRYGAGLEESPEDRRMRAFAAIAEGLSSSPRLSKGLSAALSGLVKSETEARRARREGMKEVMTLEDAAANLQIAMQEQALADRTGDNKLKTAAAVAVAQAQQAYQKALFDQAVTQQRADAETLTAQARTADVKQGGSNAGTTAVLAQRRLILENEIKRLEEAANPLSPTTEAVKAAARTRADALRRELLALGGVESGGATAPTAGTQYDFDPATNKLVPRAQ